MSDVGTTDVTNEVSESWTTVAPAWDDHAEFVEQIKAPITDRLLELLRIRPGDRVLELGAGPGGLGARLARLTGPGGHVIVSDLAPGMVAAATRRLADLRVVDVRRLDASATGLADESQDVVVFRMGLMLVPEPAGAVREIRRVLAAGGRVGFAVWASPEQNPWMTSVGMAAMMHGLVAGGPPTGPGGVFSLAGPNALAQAIGAAGFERVATEQIPVIVPFPDLDTYFAYITSMAGPLAHAIASASVDQLAALRTTVAGLTEGFRDDDGGYALPGLANVAVAAC